MYYDVHSVFRAGLLFSVLFLFPVLMGSCVCREAVSECHVIPPPPDMKLIIDKMADYVARNGPEFEIVVRRRNDERFRFVESNHPHHAYYVHKRDAFLQVMTNSDGF